MPHAFDAARSKEPVDPDLPPGTRFGQYTIGRLLGRGGMGAVHEAFHLSLRRPMALKTIRRERAPDQDAADRFRREMAVIGQLQHPHIVLAHDAGEIDGISYLAMELVDGAHVGHLVRHWGVLSVADACEIVRQVALALEHAHANGLVHRDIKPSNLLLARSGQVKVSDLGLARSCDDEEWVESLTGSGHTLGTVDYMSPEQIRGDPSIDGRSDLYSCGCTLFELLTGRPPFSGPEFKTGISKLRAHEFVSPPRARELRQEIPPELDDLVAQLIEKRPERRPAGAHELVGRLAPFAPSANLARLLEGMGQSDESSVDNALCSTPVGGTHSTIIVRNPLARGLPMHSDVPVAGTRKKALKRGLAALCAFAVLAFAGWVGFGVRPRTDETPRAPESRGDEPAPGVVRKPFQLLSPDEIEHQRWYSLLELEPTRVVWPSGGGLSTWRFDPERDQYAATCHWDGAVSLANVPAEDFLLELDLGQVNWNGRIGVFWGLHEFDDGMQAGWECQLIRLVRNETKPVGGYWLMRSTQRFTRTSLSPTGYEEDSISDGGRADIPDPIGPTSRVELRIRRGKLEESRWNGVKLEWRRASREAVVPDGQVGVFVTNTDVVVRSARVMIP